MPSPRRTTLAALALLCATGCSPAATTIVGTLHSSGGELGTFDLTPDRCRTLPALGAVDMLDSRDSSVTIRIDHPIQGDQSMIVIANRRAPEGPQELVFKNGAGCVVRVGYHDRQDTGGIGLRLDCTTPRGGHVSGLVAAGECR